ncbi:proteasome regulatory particle base subunit rpn10 [Ceratobasidium sp. 394]|nr:proteasome regulatory particle base subunit rpn10 [Ceratobasidium sp. 394]
MLEATILLIDNSEYMRNGDYQPSRFGAQADAVNVVFNSKTDANPESTVGLMTMAGKAPEVLVTPTTNHGKILSALHATKIGGNADLATGLAVAQLALKHRQNKNQRQRIVVFLGSPLDADEKSLGDVEMDDDDVDADEVDEEMSEEEAIARAIEMSMKEEEEQAKGKYAVPAEDDRLLWSPTFR